MGSANAAPEVTTVHRDGRFKGAGGVEIYWQSWRPEGECRATVVVAHGGSEHSGRYRYLVERLVPDGYAVTALDHRGHGRSKGPRAVIDRMDRALTDLDAVIVNAGRPVFLLGHSVGGCMAIAYALRHQAKLDGLILSSPVAALEAAPLALRVIARALSITAPRTPLLAIDAEGISRDPDEVRAYIQDPLNHHGKLPARTITELADAVQEFPDRVEALTLPMLIVHGTADRVVPIKGAEMVAAHAGSTDLTFTRYEGGYHELMNEPPAERAQVLDEIAEWLAARTP